MNDREVRAGGGRGWGSGLGLPASHTTQARITHEHMGPQRTYMHVYTPIHTGLAHACTRMCPSCPVALLQALRGCISSHTCPHGDGKGQKQAGWDSTAWDRSALLAPGARGGGSSPPGFQPPETQDPTRLSDLTAGLKIHRRSQETYCPAWGRCLLCTRHVLAGER